MNSSGKQADKILVAAKKRRGRLKVFLGLAVLVTAGTLAALTLRGQAMNRVRRVLECPYTPHQHTAACYQPGSPAPACGRAELLIHQHNADCYDGDTLCCTLQEQAGHTHTDSCYTVERVLACGQEAGQPQPAEGEVRPAHTHTDACYTAETVRQLTCGEEERPAHTHTDACYTVETAQQLTCGQEEGEEHTHTDACYTAVENKTLTCGQEEQPGHTHTDECYTEVEQRTLTCGQEEGQPQPAEGELQTAHTHTDACYTEVRTLTCGLLQPHLHTAACYDANGQLTCPLPEAEEHTHTEDCFRMVEGQMDPNARPIVARQTVYEDENLRLTADYDSTTALSEQVELRTVAADTPLPTRVAALPEEPQPGAAPADADGADDSAAAADSQPAQPAGSAAQAPQAEEPAAPAEPPAATPAPQPEEPAVPAAPAEPPAAPETSPEEPAEAPADAPAATPAPDGAEAGPEGLTEDGGEAPGEAPAAPRPEGPEEEEEELLRPAFFEGGEELLPAAAVTYTLQYLDEKGQPLGEPETYYYIPGEGVPAFAARAPRYRKVCRTDEFIVTAVYTRAARIPEGAELRAFAVTDPEELAQREAEYREALNSRRAGIIQLLDIGFWLGEEEIQPAAPVTITVQLLGENGLPEGEPVVVVHFAEAGAELLEATVADSGDTTFEMDSFSRVAIGTAPTAGEGGRVSIDREFSWQDEGGRYDLTFHIKGVAAPEGEAGEAEEEEKEDPAAEDAGPDAEGEEPLPAANPALLQFELEPLADADPAAALYRLYADANPAGQLLDLSVLRYALYYDGQKLDLSGCEITVTVRPTQAAVDRADATAGLTAQDVGDEDGDGYVTGPDGESLMPLPLPEHGVQLSVVAPAAVPAGDAAAEETAEEAPAAPKTEEDPVAEGEADAGPALAALQVSGSMVLNRNDPITQLNQLLGGFDAQPQAEGEGEEAAEEEPSLIFSLQAGPQADLPGELADTFSLEEVQLPNPHYQVQYYAYLDRVHTEDNALGNGNDSRIPVIDTSNGGENKEGKLPQNFTAATANGAAASPNANALKYMEVTGTQVKYDQDQLTEVYTEKDYYYYRNPSVMYVNKLLRNTSYKLSQIWVLKPEAERVTKDKAEALKSTNEADWYRYDYDEHLHFTNRSRRDDNVVKDLYVIGDEKYIMIRRDDANPQEILTTLRFVYTVEEGKLVNPTTFYDYDISDGGGYATEADAQQAYKNNDGDKGNDKKLVYGKIATSKVYNGDALNVGLSQQSVDSKKSLFLNVNKQGINSPGNYSGNGTKLAFGNNNVPTGLGRERWGNNYINRTNQNINEAGFTDNTNYWGYNGLVFGLVTGLDGNGNLIYASGIDAPKLFAEGPAAGKTTHSDYSLEFSRSGDTYTLTTVRKGADPEKGVEGVAVAAGLDQFAHMQNWNKSRTIWYNNFWPMDSAPSYNTDGHDPKIGGNMGNTALYGVGTLATNSAGAMGERMDTMPSSDNGQFHNPYFGMHYQVKFNLTEEYIGPLEYYFFGDDDMWVFLDGKLVCDIGGVHSSVGEYVNLWDYLAKEDEASAGEHTLDFYYTERGASGSTCWMQFTLPSVTSGIRDVPPGDYGSLRVDKQLLKSTNGGEYEHADNGEEFVFKLEIASATGNVLPDDMRYIKYKADGTEEEHLVWNGSYFTLKDGEYITIDYLPLNAKYTVTEAKSGRTVISDGTVVKDSQYKYDTEYEYNNGEAQAGNAASGAIQSGQNNNLLFINKYDVFELPKTGGGGTARYLAGGAALAAAAGAALFAGRKRKKGG